MPRTKGMTQGYNAQAAVESRQAGLEESLPEAPNRVHPLRQKGGEEILP